MSRAKRDENLVNAIASSLSKVTDGVISSDGDVFNSNLPEGLTPETVEAVSNYTTAFVASGLEAVGKAAVSAMEKDKKLNDVSAEIPMGAFGNVGYGVTRSREAVVPGTDKTTTVYGGTKVNVAFVAGKNAGQLAAAKRSIKEMAEEALKK